MKPATIPVRLTGERSSAELKNYFKETALPGIVKMLTMKETDEGTAIEPISSTIDFAYVVTP